MIVELTQTVNAPASAVWQVMGEDFDSIAEVVSGVYASQKRPGDGVNGAPMAGRVCYTSMGKHPLIETIKVWDPKARKVSYEAKSKSFPGFVKSLVNNWEFVEINDTQTEVRMRLEGELSFPFNHLMGGMMARRFKKIMPGLISEMEHYARTGKKHPEKTAFDATAKAEKTRNQLTAAALNIG
ncbi:MAG: SRPBCC family protein [Pseudomonadota bacterium]